MNVSLSLFALLFALSTTACVPPPARPKSMKEKAGAVGDGNSTVDGGSSGVGVGTEGDGTGTGTGPTGGDSSGGTDAGTGTGSMGGGDGGMGTGGMGDGGGDKGTTEPKGPALLTSPRFDEIVWLTAHNAFVNDDDAGWKVVNQSRSLQYQLDNGVTAFMIDIHSFEGDAIMCHESCDGSNTPLKFPIPGVHEKMPVLPYFNTFNDFLNKHPDAFITIIIEDRVNSGEKAKLAKYFKDSGLFDKTFDPYKWDVTNKGWPRLDALKKDGKRLFVISDRSDKKDLGMTYAQDFTRENYWSLGKSKTVGLDYSCKPRWDKTQLNDIGKNFQYLTVMNHFRDIPSFEFAKEDNKLDLLWKRLNENCLKEYQRKPNFFAVDHFDEADWGARKLVEDLRLYGVTLYKDKGLIGSMKMLKEGKYLAKDLGIGNDELDSIKVNAGFRIKIYEDDNYQKLLGEFVEDVRDLGDKGNKASSVIIERK